MKQFFLENNKLSMGRLLSFLTCVTGLAIGVVAAIKGNANTAIASISLGFVTAGIAGKVLGKSKESK